MPEDAASLSLFFARSASATFFTYLAAGAVFALLFSLRGGLARVDPATRGSSPFFRLLILPATLALWPWLLRRWRRASREAR